MSQIDEVLERIRRNHRIEVTFGDTAGWESDVLRELEVFERGLESMERRNGAPLFRAGFGPQVFRRMQ